MLIAPVSRQKPFNCFSSRHYSNGVLETTSLRSLDEEGNFYSIRPNHGNKHAKYSQRRYGLPPMLNGTPNKKSANSLDRLTTGSSTNSNKVSQRTMLPSLKSPESRDGKKEFILSLSTSKNRQNSQLRNNPFN